MKPAAAGLFEKIREAGIVEVRQGLPLQDLLARGGDLLVADGITEEPLVRASSHMVTHAARELVRGMHLALEAAGMRRAVIALKRTDRAAVAAARAALLTVTNPRYLIEVREVSPSYPRDPAEIARDPSWQLLWLDVMTLCHLGDVHQGHRVTHRAVTVTGAVREPRTFWAPLGASFADLIMAAGGPADGRPHWLLVGGPLSGALQPHLEGQLDHGTHTLALLPADHRLVRLQGMPLSRMLRRAQATCHGCERCTEICPAYLAGGPLRPHRIMRALHAEMDRPAEVLAAAQACTDCRLCTLFACPSELDPARLVREVARAQQTAGHPMPSRSFGEREVRRLPLGRLARHLELTGLDHVAPLQTQPLQVTRLVRNLEAGHVATVKPGDVVKPEQLIARALPESGAVPLYTGLAGVVESLGDTIVIKGT